MANSINLAFEPTPLQLLERASFGDVEFAFDKRTLQGGTRYYLHQYPRLPGAKLEKLGRKPYVFRFHAYFHDLPGTAYATLFPNAYPRKLNDLRVLFENEETKDLVVPGVGKVKAYCTSWTQDMDVRVQSGENFDLEFVEDVEDLFLATEFREASTDIEQKLDSFNEAAARAEYKALDEQPEPSIFGQIREAVGKVIAVRDQVELQTMMVESKIREVEDLCREADKTVVALQNPVNHVLIDALKDLWAAHVQLAEDATGKGTRIDKYVVPQTASVAQVAFSIYGDSNRSTDLLALNDFPDVFAIPSGSVVRYYAEGL